jgi:Trk K+ transport system NAD-binding subunit
MRRDETGREWNKAMAATLTGHVILCGLGKLGIRVLQELLQLGEQVIVLEKDPQCPNIAFAQSNGVSVTIGTGREAGIFEDLNVARAKSIIIATNDDLANLEMSLDVKRLSPGIRVVLRLFDQELAEKVRQSFDVSQAFSTSSLAAPLFATSSSDGSIINSFYIRDKLLVVANIEIRRGSELIGRKVRDLRNRDGALIVAHERGAAANFFPDGETTLQEGDRISIQTDPQRLQDIHRWNEPVKE